MRQVIIHPAPHPLDLNVDGFGNFALAHSASAVGLLREDRKGCFQTVSKIAGFSLGFANRALTVLQQSIQIIDQRLDFRRIRSVDLPAPALPDRGQAIPELVERVQALPYLPNRRGKETGSGSDDDQVHGMEMSEHHQANGAQKYSPADPRTKRRRGSHRRSHGWSTI
jgi:hypothetical protein